MHLGPDCEWLDEYSIDQAVWSFGVALEQELDAAEASKKTERAKKSARAQVMARWFPDVTADTPRHRDPGKDNPEGMRR